MLLDCLIRYVPHMEIEYQAVDVAEVKRMLKEDAAHHAKSVLNSSGALAAVERDSTVEWLSGAVGKQSNLKADQTSELSEAAVTPGTDLTQTSVSTPRDQQQHNSGSGQRKKGKGKR